ncbi:hypothetical protein GW17_00048507 [Ensete ventricosum]|nr:hypothetical protein GW17_00048507 [Ensete ventricosum]
MAVCATELFRCVFSEGGGDECPGNQFQRVPNTKPPNSLRFGNGGTVDQQSLFFSRGRTHTFPRYTSMQRAVQHEDPRDDDKSRLGQSDGRTSSSTKYQICLWLIDSLGIAPHRDTLKGEEHQMTEFMDIGMEIVRRCHRTSLVL